ncbi:MAG: tRNA (cytidine(34)-2'-O)-methyltransferase [Spirochaetia bacterium]
MSIAIVLVEPEIPQNTGNIARTCAAVGASLHLVKPLGFSVSDKHVRRAGLDYWNLVDVHVHENLHAVQRALSDRKWVLVTKKAKTSYTDIEYNKDVCLFFGKETAGLPESFLSSYPESCVRIPMVPDARSLNLSNAAAVLVYEALRQQNFPGLSIPYPDIL